MGAFSQEPQNKEEWIKYTKYLLENRAFAKWYGKNDCYFFVTYADIVNHDNMPHVAIAELAIQPAYANKEVGISISHYVLPVNEVYGRTCCARIMGVGEFTRLFNLCRRMLMTYVGYGIRDCGEDGRELNKETEDNGLRPEEEKKEPAKLGDEERMTKNTEEIARERLIGKYLKIRDTRAKEEYSLIIAIQEITLEGPAFGEERWCIYGPVVAKSSNRDDNAWAGRLTTREMMEFVDTGRLERQFGLEGEPGQCTWELIYTLETPHS